MKQRFSPLICYFVTLTLMASVIAGALSVSVHFADADTPTSVQVYIGDLLNEVQNLSFVSGDQLNKQKVLSFIDYMTTHFDTELFVAIKEGDNYCFASYYTTDSSHHFAVWSSQTYFGSVNQAYFYRTSFLLVSPSNNNCVYNNTTSNRLNQEGAKLSWTSTSIQTTCVPNKANFDVSGRIVYFNQKIYSQYGASTVFQINLLPGSSAPVIIDFDIVVFWIGTRRYLTIKDQSLIRQLNGGGLMEYILEVNYYLDAESWLTATYEYGNVVLISYPGDIAYDLENVSPQGVYCIDITNHPATIIEEAKIFDTYTLDDYLVAECVNCPYVLQEEAPEPGTEGTPDSYTQAWSVYNEYVSNYNTTSVVPESLSDRIFSTSGAKTLPAEILIPDTLVTSSGTAVVNPVFLWSFGSQVDGSVSVIDYSLCDVCVIPYNQTSYAMKFWYGSGAAQQYSSIDTFEFDRILDMYDVILIVNSYPDFLFDSGVPGPASVYSRGFTGTSADMQYVDAISIGTVGDQRFSCFAIVTERCLQKTQLYNFSDGISKLYNLMVDYVQSEDDWKASFLLWSSSMFSAVDTLNGRLDQIKQAIVNLNQDLNTKLDTLINNTSPDIPEGDVWYTSIWNWILQFKPTNENFSNSLQVYDDNWDQIPQISAAPSVPLIPTIGG